MEIVRTLSVTLLALLKLLVLHISESIGVENLHYLVGQRTQGSNQKVTAECSLRGYFQKLLKAS